VECCSHRDQRVICGTLAASCPYCCPLALFFPPLSCMGRERSSGCCVILRSRSIDATSNLFPSCLIPDNGGRQRHLYLIVSTHPSLWISSRLRFPTTTTPSLCVRSPILSCSRSYRMCILLTTFDPFLRVYIFYLTFLLPTCLYSSLTVVLP